MHEPELEVSRWFPSGVAAGAELVCTIQVRCPSACDLRGAEVSVVAPDGLVASSEIIRYEQGINNSGEVALKAPLAVGDHQWSILFRPSPHENEPSAHAESSLLLPFSTQSHGSSLAIWDVPSPVVRGEPFSIKVGAKCSEGCDLQGIKVEIYNGLGATLTTAKFGDAPWSGSDALYWTEVELVAPTTEQGVASWSVGLPTPDLELPHEPTSSKFSFATTRPPEHELTVQVVEEGSIAAPVPNAEVRLGVYQASTDEFGRATVAVAGGNYQLLVWKVGYETHPEAIEVSKDLAVRIQATVLPDNSDWEDD